MYTRCIMSCMCASMRGDVRTICGDSNNSHKGKMKDQKKAIGKMKDVSQGQGRTVLFVSQNMASEKAYKQAA